MKLTRYSGFALQSNLKPLPPEQVNPSNSSTQPSPAYVGPLDQPEYPDLAALEVTQSVAGHPDRVVGLLDHFELHLLLRKAGHKSHKRPASKAQILHFLRADEVRRLSLKPPLNHNKNVTRPDLLDLPNVHVVVVSVDRRAERLPSDSWYNRRRKLRENVVNESGRLAVEVHVEA